MTKLTASKLTNLGLGTALAGIMLAAPLMASADMSASIAVSSMYLWRGQDLSNASPEVSGDFYYTDASGLYTGIWASSEGVSGSHETDLNVGFSKKFGDVGMDVGVYEYLYTDNGQKKVDWQDTDAAEYYIGVSYAPVSVKLLQNTAKPDSRYLTVDGAFGKFGAHIAQTFAKTSSAEYTDYNVSFTPVDNLTWTVSMASGDGAPQEDPLFVVSYKWPFTVK